MKKLIEKPDEYRAEVHQKLLDIRNFFNIINSSKFEEAWSRATKEQIEKFLGLLVRMQPKEVQELIQEINYNELHLMPVLKLRKLGQQLKVIGYNVLPKNVLMTRIAYAQAAAAKDEAVVKDGECTEKPVHENLSGDDSLGSASEDESW